MYALLSYREQQTIPTRYQEYRYRIYFVKECQLRWRCFSPTFYRIVLYAAISLTSDIGRNAVISELCHNDVTILRKMLSGSVMNKLKWKWNSLHSFLRKESHSIVF